MRYCRQVTASLINPAFVLAAVLMGTTFSCVVPKNYPKNKPFVYKTNIKIQAKLPSDERQELTARLQNQIDDSLQIKTVISPPFLYKTLNTPPVFDSINVYHSNLYMISLLNSIGYNAPLIKDSITLKIKKGDQYRTTIDFFVYPGKRILIDSVGFSLDYPPLQQLALQSKGQSLIKKGKPYTKQILSLEIDRLVDSFRNNGYYRFSKEDLYIEHDTVIAGLINPTLDPFEQATLFEELKKQRETPRINLVVKQRPPKDSTHLTKYYLGQVTVYPDMSIAEDTVTQNNPDTTVINGITVVSRTDKFKLPFIVHNIYLRPGSLFKQENYFKTYNRFSQLSAWQYNNIDFDVSPISDSLLDAAIRLYPAKKQKLTVSLEFSRNSNDIVTASNFFGVGLNFQLQNRNAFKQSVRTSTDLRTGVEFGSTFIETEQASISHTIYFPRTIVPSFINTEKLESNFKNIQTLVNANASYTYQNALFTLISINGSWGYQAVKNNKSYLLKIPNIEYNYVDEKDSLIDLIKYTPSLQEAFRSGFVVGTQFVYTSIRANKNKTNRFRFTAEQSGALLGFINALDKAGLLRFIKGDVEYLHNIDYGKTQLVMRGYAGAGIAYGNTDAAYQQTQTLPFYKAFWAGGPNSMRAWQVRRLGLGSSYWYNDSASRQLLDRFGDIQLEGNLEYRFPLGTIFGFKLKSAIFTDVGNIWSRKPIDSSPAAIGSDFQLNNFYKQFAVDAGTGLRLDFSYFLIRLDWAYKIRDPNRMVDPNRWFYDLSIGSGQLQLGIGYPF
jgi:outer membrane protein insertion porin family